MSAVALSLLLLLSAGTGEQAFWEVRIELADVAAQSLASEPRKEVTARVRFGQHKAMETRVKLKGHGSFQRLEQKPSFTLQFDSAVSAQVPFRGSKIHLNNSIEDSSYLKEKIGAELFGAAGIATPRVAHARVHLNERELGLYVLKEGFSEEFMLRSFGTTNGTLYDSDSSEQKEGVEQMDVDAGDDARGRAKLKELWAAASEAEMEKRFERLQPVLDVDEFLRFIALEVLLCHWDGYALSENNFRIYVPADGKIQFLPAGMDQIFAKADLPWKPNFSGKLARALMESEFAEKRYETMFTGQFGSVLDTERISKRMGEMVDELSPHLTKAEQRLLQGGAEELGRSIAARKESLRLQLERGEAMALTFTNGSAVVAGWERVGVTDSVKMKQVGSNLMTQAGPKTSASWRAKVRLPAGRYRFRSQVETRDVVPLSFGNRQGACLRVVGKNTQSGSLVGTSSGRLECEFEVVGEEVLVMVCELRASGGEAVFENPILVSQMAVK